MDARAFEAFLNGRYLDQLGWYEERAAQKKQLHVRAQWVVIVFAASLPVLIAELPERLRWITITISIVLAIATGAAKVFRFQEDWLLYRAIAERLKRERVFFETRIAGYGAAADPEALFVARVEDLLAQENALWVSVHTPKEEAQPQTQSAAS